MLFRKKIEPSCIYCAHGTVLGEDQILCARKGLVECINNCPKFRYDPCKRVPPRPKQPDFEQFHDEDFSL